MSDKVSIWFRKHVQIIKECQKRVMSLKIESDFAEYKKRGLEVLSALLWVNMVLWIELCSIILYVFIFVRNATNFKNCQTVF